MGPLQNLISSSVKCTVAKVNLWRQNEVKRNFSTICLTLSLYMLRSLLWSFNIKQIWPTSWENLFMTYANNKGADQPAHPGSLISTFVVHMLDSILPILAIPEISRVQLVSVALQASLSFTCSQTPKTGFLMMGLIYDLIQNPFRTLSWSVKETQLGKNNVWSLPKGNQE